jgi:hypothetical protein
MPTDSAIDEYEYLWRHFAFNAEQRLKGFNFFVVLAVFADGGVFTALEQQAHWLVLLLLGGFVSVLAIVFWLIDCRSQALIALALPGLQEHESRLSARARIFANDSPSVWVRYTTAFNILFVLQFLFGLGVMLYAVVYLAH